MRDAENGNMKHPKKAFPLAVCTLCGYLTNRPRVINLPCFREYNEKRCEGTVVSAPVEGWSECPKCSATGREGDAKCVRCGGWGWHYRRRYVS
jgi:uncharacterized paraquat-inducible protein A